MYPIIEHQAKPSQRGVRGTSVRRGRFVDHRLRFEKGFDGHQVVLKRDTVPRAGGVEGTVTQEQRGPNDVKPHSGNHREGLGGKKMNETTAEETQGTNEGMHAGFGSHVL